MPFDVKKIQEDDGILLYTLVREWEHEGHDVGLFILKNPKFPDLKNSPSPMCECDFDIEEKVDENGRKHRVHVRDSRDCPHLAAFRKLCRQEAREKYGEAWREMGVKEAIIDIHERVKTGEYLGTAWGGMIYLQTVGELLGVPVPWKEADELFKEERLQLNGAILCDYHQRFRFPQEIKGLIRYVIEAPMGWPNGDAGECFVGGLCQLIEENTGLTHGRELFGDDFPNVRPERLLVLALALLRTTVERAKNSPEALKGLYFMDLNQCANELTQAAAELQKIEASLGQKYDTRSVKPHYLAHLILNDTSNDTTRFRFPRELRQALTYLMYEPGSDWRSAEQSMLGLEQAIAMHGRWLNGGDAFWEHNYPHLSTDELVMFALSWLKLAEQSAELDEEVREHMGRDLLAIAQGDCRMLATRFEKLHRLKSGLAKVKRPQKK